MFSTEHQLRRSAAIGPGRINSSTGRLTKLFPKLWHELAKTVEISRRLCNNGQFNTGWAVLLWIRSATSRSATALQAAAFCPRFVIRAACLEIRLVKCRLKTLFRTAAAHKQGDSTAGVITVASALIRSMTVHSGTPPSI